MTEESNDPANEAGLHEYVDAEFIVEGLDSPNGEKVLRDALLKIGGLEDFSILHGKVTAHYEPVLVSKKQLEAAIRGAGFQVTDVHETSSSPLIDALAGEKQSPEKI